MATKRNSIKYFKEGANELNARTIPTGDFNTAEMDVDDFNGPYMIEVYRSGTDGNVKWSVEVSNDLVNWQKISQSAQMLVVGCGVQDDQCYPNYFRLTFTISGNPTGTLTAFFTRVNTNQSF